MNSVLTRTAPAARPRRMSLSRSIKIALVLASLLVGFLVIIAVLLIHALLIVWAIQSKPILPPMPPLWPRWL